MKTIFYIFLALSAAVSAAQGVDHIKDNNAGWRASETPDPAERVQRSSDTSVSKSEGGGGGGGANYKK